MGATGEAVIEACLDCFRNKVDCGLFGVVAKLLTEPFKEGVVQQLVWTTEKTKSFFKLLLRGKSLKLTISGKIEPHVVCVNPQLTFPASEACPSSSNPLVLRPLTLAVPYLLLRHAIRDSADAEDGLLREPVTIPCSLQEVARQGIPNKDHYPFDPPPCRLTTVR